MKTGQIQLFQNILKHDTNDPIVQSEEPLFKVQRIIGKEFHINSLERDLGKRLQIWEYSQPHWR